MMIARWFRLFVANLYRRNLGKCSILTYLYFSNYAIEIIDTFQIYENCTTFCFKSQIINLVFSKLYHVNTKPKHPCFLNISIPSLARQLPFSCADMEVLACSEKPRTVKTGDRSFLHRVIIPYPPGPRNSYRLEKNTSKTPMYKAGPYDRYKWGCNF